MAGEASGGSANARIEDLRSVVETLSSDLRDATAEARARDQDLQQCVSEIREELAASRADRATVKAELATMTECVFGKSPGLKAIVERHAFIVAVLSVLTGALTVVAVGRAFAFFADKLDKLGKLP